MAKKFGKSLDEALAETDAADVVKGLAEPPPPEPIRYAPPAMIQPEVERRLDIVPLTIHVAPEDRRRLRQLSLDAGMSMQQLGIVAWSLLLESRGLPPMKPTKANVPDGRRRKANGAGGA